MPFILCVQGNNEGEEWEVGDEALILGRSKDASAPILDTKVSRQHARITRRGAHYFIEDLGSQNGTFMDGQKIEKPYVLQNEHIFKLGNSTFVFSKNSLLTQASGAVDAKFLEILMKKGMDQEFNEDPLQLVSKQKEEVLKDKPQMMIGRKRERPGSLEWMLKVIKEKRRDTDKSSD